MAMFEFWHSMQEEPYVNAYVVLTNKYYDMWLAIYYGNGEYKIDDKGKLPVNIFSKDKFVAWGYWRDLIEKTNLDEVR